MFLYIWIYDELRIIHVSHWLPWAEESTPWIKNILHHSFVGPLEIVDVINCHELPKFSLLVLAAGGNPVERWHKLSGGRMHYLQPCDG